MSRYAPITASDFFFIGEDKTLAFTIYDPDATEAEILAQTATPQDITGWTIEWVVKVRTSDSAALLTKDGTAIDLTESTLGIVKVQVDRDDTKDLFGGNYVHSLVRTDTDDYGELAFGPAVLRKGAEGAGVAGPFATLEDLQAFLQRNDLGPAAILDLGVATGIIRRDTGQTISLVGVDVVALNGRDRPSLFLPQIPVVEVASVVADGTTLVEDTDFSIDPNTGILTRLPIGAHWTVGKKNVVVTYTHGFDPIPEDIRGACCMIAAKLWTNPTRNTAERTSQYSASLDGLIGEAEQAILNLYALGSS
jgi:hypothetical protein